MTDAPAVIDNQAASRFEYTENGRLAQLTYRVRPGRLVLLHTETPPSSRAGASAAPWSARPSSGPSASA